MGNTKKQWLVLYTKSRSEKKAKEYLEKRGFECFLPTYKTLRQWSDRKKKVELVLIPSYLFVHVDEAERRMALECPYTVQYIYWQGKPAIVRDNEIDSLKRLVSEKSPEEEIETFHFEPGDEVVIERGNFAGRDAKVLEQKGKKVQVLLKELGLVVRVKIDTDAISKS
ncbi:MAG: UpxY family transcription antiterminator [Cyclobacteriaceae bacterium]|nr:UpxY family transcription antiterminator [Cyclobacteriaceae bacterium]MCH8515112.1 UpxY family transcription antiterminator [Cyclobacteriaceae bacterium]